MGANFYDVLQEGCLAAKMAITLLSSFLRPSTREQYSYSSMARLQLLERR